MLGAEKKNPCLKMGYKELTEHILDIAIKMRIGSDYELRDFKVFVSEHDYDLIRAGVQDWTDAMVVDMEPTEYMNGCRTLYYAHGLRLLIEKDNSITDNNPVIMTFGNEV